MLTGVVIRIYWRIILETIIGRNIQAIRTYRGMTAADLSRAANVPKNTLSELENRTQHQSVWTMYKIAKALNCSIESLLSSEMPSATRYLTHKTYREAQEAAFDAQII